MRDGDEVGAGCCALCVGIVLLHQSYECFCNANTNTSCKGSEVTAPAVLTTVTPRLPRLRALKLANELKAAVTTTLQSREVPCTCLQIRGASVVAQMVQCCSSLSHFVTTNRFDFFYQAPWVSGAHSVGHIAQAADAGSKAWHFSYLVGTLLHVYNALVQSKLIDPTAVPILEALCDVYEDVLFLGKRSSHNVLSCWQRWAGGKVAKATTHRNQTSLTTLASGEVVENKKWHLCAVPDSSQGGNRWSRSFDPKKISLFSLLAGGASVIDDEVLVWVYLPKEKRHRYQDKDVAKAKALFEQKNLLAYHIDRVQSLLEEEFRTTDSSPSSSSVPVARINYFAVYQACTLAMRNISDANHDEDPGYICKCPAEACMRECDAFLKRRMLGSGGKKSAKPKEMKGSDSCAEHILQVFGGRGVEEFLWKV